jgi:hypothetical protein
MAQDVTMPAPLWRVVERPAVARSASRQAAWAGGLVLLVLLTRVPFRSLTLYAWDAGNFAFALERFNVTAHQPQPPGYILYVMAARLFHLVLPDANASYVWLNIAGSVATTVLLLLVTWRLFGEFVAVVATLLFTTSNEFWSNGETAFPYVWLAFFACLVALLGAETRWGSRNLTVANALALGVGGGFRPDLLAFLLPLWLYCSWRRGWRTLLLGVLVIGIVVAAWFLPTVQLSGGWAAYQRTSSSYGGVWLSQTSILFGTIRNAVVNYAEVADLTIAGVGLGLIPIAYGVGRLLRPQDLMRDDRLRFLMVWLLGPWPVYVFLHIGNPGYILSFLPALTVFAAVALTTMAADLSEAWAMWHRTGSGLLSRLTPSATSIAAAAIVFFSLANLVMFFGSDRVGRNQAIRAEDRNLTEIPRFLRATYPPQSTRVIAFDRYRQLQWYLKEYELSLLFDNSWTDWQTRRTTLVADRPLTVVFADLRRNDAEVGANRVEKRVLAPDTVVYVVQLQPGETLVHGFNYAAVRATQAGP